MLNRDFVIQLIIITVLVFLQVFVFNNVLFGGRYHPLVFIIGILFLPLRFSYSTLMISAFLLGLSLDFWMGSLGVNAFCCLITAQLRVFYVKKVLEQSDDQFMTLSEFSSISFFIYLFTFSIFYNILLYTIQSFNFSNFIYSFGQGFINGIVSFAFILVFYLLFRNRLLR